MTASIVCEADRLRPEARAEVQRVTRASSNPGTAVLPVATAEPSGQAEAPRDTGSDSTRSDAQGDIVETAERLYRQFGHHKATVADIARALSMSPANIYRFFHSKDAISAAVCRCMLNDLVSAAAQIAQRSAPAEDRLRAVLLELVCRNVERSRTDKPLHRLLVAATGKNWPLVAEHAARHGDAQRAGRCVHAAMMRYLHPGLILERVAIGEPMPDAMVDFCLEALR